jgi:hypothetical protein
MTRNTGRAQCAHTVDPCNTVKISAAQAVAEVDDRKSRAAAVAEVDDRKSRAAAGAEAAASGLAARDGGGSVASRHRSRRGTRIHTRTTVLTTGGQHKV